MGLVRVIWHIENEETGQGCAWCGEGAERGVCGNCASEDTLNLWWEHVGRSKYALVLSEMLGERKPTVL